VRIYKGAVSIRTIPASYFRALGSLTTIGAVAGEAASAMVVKRAGVKRYVLPSPPAYIFIGR
jgi:hypothetical protein